MTEIVAIEIGTLGVDGLDRAEAAQLAEALAQELQRLMQRGASVRTDMARRDLESEIRGDSPETMGRELARRLVSADAGGETV